MQLREWLDREEVRLRKGPHPERARLDAEALLMFLLGCDRAFFIAHSDEMLSAEGVVRYHALIDRRLAGEPIQYIAGQSEFYGLPFAVNHAVLIPRPETEHVVEKVLEVAGGFDQPGSATTGRRGWGGRPRIVDLGTGSGAIAVALACHIETATLTATDLSHAALELARENALRNSVGERIRFLHGDLLAPVSGEQFEIVVSNPPYVAEGDRDLLSVEVRNYEPHQALFAGADGLAVYRRLIPQAYDALVPGGFLVLEIGYGQAEAVAALLAQAGFIQAAFTPDLQGISRVAAARKP